MTATVLLRRLRDKGVELRVDGDRLLLSPASVLLPEELEQAKVLKPELIRLLAPWPDLAPVQLRLAIRRWFALTVAEMDGQRPGSGEVDELRQVIFKLEDEAGPLYAEALIGEEAGHFRWETGRCGWCGNGGHDGGCGR